MMVQNLRQSKLQKIALKMKLNINFHFWKRLSHTSFLNSSSDQLKRYNDMILSGEKTFKGLITTFFVE